MQNDQNPQKSEDTKPQNPQQNPQEKPQEKPQETPAKAPSLFAVPFGNAEVEGSLKKTGDNTFNGGLNLRFNDGNNIGGSTTFNTRTQTVERYGAEAGVKYGDKGRVDIAADALPPKSATTFNVKVKLDTEYDPSVRLKTEFSPKGEKYDAGGSFKVDGGKTTIDARGTFGADNGFGATVSHDNKSGVKAQIGVDIGVKDGDIASSKISGSFERKKDGSTFGVEVSGDPAKGEVKGTVSYTTDFGSKKPAPLPDPVPQNAPPPNGGANGNPFTDREKQAIATLGPQDRALYDQAAAGVRKLNDEKGASLPVPETAAALASLANEKGMTRIDQVVIGDPQPNGRQNVFAIQGAPGDPGAKTAYADKEVLANTSVEVSVHRLRNTPDAIEQAAPSKSIAPRQ